MLDNVGKAASEYEKLVPLRAPFLEMARKCASLTIPSLMRPENYSATSGRNYAFSNIGADGLTNLSSKMTLAMLPPNQPFFKAIPNQFDLEDLRKNDPDLAEAFDSDLFNYEQSILGDIDTSTDRSGWNAAAKQWLCAGNVLVQEREGGLRHWPMDRYVQRCDRAGNPIMVIIKEMIHKDRLPKTIEVPPEKAESTDEVAVYTMIQWKDKRVYVHQEVFDQMVEGSDGEWPEEVCPYITLSYTDKGGEHWSSSYVEEKLGDLDAYNALGEYILQGTAASVKLLALVDPSGITQIEDVQDAPNGAIRPGRAADVQFVQIAKAADLSVAIQRLSTLEMSLHKSFLMNSGVQRDAERVTAEEIRFMAQELDTTLSGQFSLLDPKFQRPFLRAKIHRLEISKKIQILTDKVKLTIITGLDALGRSSDMQRLDTALGMLAKYLGPDFLKTALNPTTVASTVFKAVGLDTKKFVRPQEEVDAQQQNDMMSGMVSKLGPSVIKEGSNMLQNLGGIQNGEQAQQLIQQLGQAGGQ